MADNVAGTYLAINPQLSDVIPPELAEFKRWTAWALLKPKPPATKPGKKPLSATNDASSWLTLPDALTAAKGRAGVGFQMYGLSTIVGIDIDGCVDADGSLNDIATRIMAALPATYAEITPSGKGLRLFASAVEGHTVPEFLNREHGLEVYVGRSARFLTVTGRVIPGRERLLSGVTHNFLRLVQPIALSVGGGVDNEIRLPVPPEERLPAWEHFFEDEERVRLPKDLLTYLREGDVPGARSERSFSVATRMLEARYTPQEVFTLLISAPGSWEAALDKRDQDVRKAREYIWADIGRAQKLIQADQSAKEARSDEWAMLGLHVEIKNKRLCVVPSQSNGVRILSKHDDWKARVALDVTTGMVMLDGKTLTDAEFFELQESVAKYAGWPPSFGRAWWADTIRAAAEKQPINPRATWIRSLKWDGTPRLDSWLIDHVAAEPTDLNQTLGRMWLISLIARWLDPGCKCDTVLVLTGSEGTRKTSFFELIAGGPEKVVMLQGFERDDRFTAAKAWLVEIPEAHLFKRVDRNRLKAFVTERVDQYRPPYAANPVVVKRGFVLVSTSNDAEMFASDQDGLRRFWPVTVRDSQINLQWIAENRDQLFAEACLAYDLEEPWWFESQPDDLRLRVAEAVESSVIDDALSSLVIAQQGKGGLTLTEIIAEITARVGHRPPERNVATLLARHGLVRQRKTTHRYWMHPTWVAGNNVLAFPEKDAKP